MIKAIKGFTDVFNGHFYAPGEVYPGIYGSLNAERVETLIKKGFLIDDATELEELRAENEELKSMVKGLEKAIMTEREEPKKKTKK